MEVRINISSDSVPKRYVCKGAFRFFRYANIVIW